MTRLLVAALFAIAPSFALAEGCQHGFGKQQMSLVCEEGMTFDPDTGKCIAIVS